MFLVYDFGIPTKLKGKVYEEGYYYLWHRTLHMRKHAHKSHVARPGMLRWMRGNSRKSN